MRRPKRAPSSATWAAQTAEARADLYASSEADDLDRALSIALPEHRRELARRALREAHLAGSEREADLHTALDVLRATVTTLRARGRDLTSQVLEQATEIERLRALKKTRDI